MDIAQAISPAATSADIVVGWGIGMVACMLLMAVMMFGMMRHGRAKDTEPGRWSSYWPERA